MRLSALGAAVLAIALLLPPGDAPWSSFWREWTASIALLLVAAGALSQLRQQRLPLRLAPISIPALALGLAALGWAQHAAGRVTSASDALLASLYLGGFALGAALAASLPGPDREALMDRIATAFLAAAVLSAPLAFLQWLGLATLDLGIPVAAGRPVAHMEQANLLCSLLIQGALGAWRLVARGRLSPPLGIGAVLLILPALVLTQSRVAWLVGLVLIGVLLARRDLFASHGQGRRVPVRVAALVVVVIAASLLLPWIDNQLGLTGASLAERTSEGRRPVVWALFLQSLLAHPWLGWGVLQNGAAQYAQALQHPSTGYFFSSAHDIVVDLMVWFGIPIGLLAGGALLVGTAARLARASTPPALITALAAAALLLHALVELPLQYTYFLLPLGLTLGAGARPAATRAAGEIRLDLAALPRPLWLAAPLLPVLLLAVLAQDYIRVCDVRPSMLLDFQTWRQVLQANGPAPQVRLLDQLEAFHEFAAVPLRPGATAPQLDAARAAMLRQPTAGAIERYALLTGINGRSEDAADAIAHLCKFEPGPNCVSSQCAWASWRKDWPQLPVWPGPAPQCLPTRKAPAGPAAQGPASTLAAPARGP